MAKTPVSTTRATPTTPILAASPLGDIGFALLAAFHDETLASVPEVIDKLEVATGEILKLPTVYELVKGYVGKGWLAVDAPKKSPLTRRNVDVYRITKTGSAAVAERRQQMTRLLKLFEEQTERERV